MKNDLQQGLLLFALLVIVALCLLFDKKHSKQSIADFYSISRPTLSKWMDLFQSDIKKDEWRRKRFLSPFEIQNIKDCFGIDSSLVLSKKQIAECAGSNYKTVAENVKNNLDKIGITIDAWDSCNAFPPVISSRILDMLG